MDSTGKYRVAGDNPVKVDASAGQSGDDVHNKMPPTAEPRVVKISKTRYPVSRYASPLK